ncbi:MAG: DNA translocase FtsK [Firmicutes bacterium]|nr:DNA translocase FtsK [Bacillota bacterium]
MNTTHGNKPSKNNLEITGVIMLVISAFFLLALILTPLLGQIGQWLKGFLVGVFGWAAYAYAASLTALGAMLMKGKRVTLPKNKVVIILGLFFISVFILHLASSAQYVAKGFGGYISGVYSGSTAGGVLAGLLVFPLAAVLGQPLAYCLFAVLMATLIFAWTDFSVFRKKRTVIRNAARPHPTFFKEESPGANSLFVSEIQPGSQPSVVTASGAPAQQPQAYAQAAQPSQSGVKQVFGFAQDSAAATAYNASKYGNGRLSVRDLLDFDEPQYGGESAKAKQKEAPKKRPERIVGEQTASATDLWLGGASFMQSEPAPAAQSSRVDVRLRPPEQPQMMDVQSVPGAQYVHNRANADYLPILNTPLNQLSGNTGGAARDSGAGVSQIIGADMPPAPYEPPTLDILKNLSAGTPARELADENAVRNAIARDSYNESYTVGSYSPSSDPIIDGTARSKELEEQRFAGVKPKENKPFDGYNYSGKPFAPLPQDTVKEEPRPPSISPVREQKPAQESKPNRASDVFDTPDRKASLAPKAPGIFGVPRDNAAPATPVINDFEDEDADLSADGFDAPARETKPAPREPAAEFGPLETPLRDFDDFTGNYEVNKAPTFEENVQKTEERLRAVRDRTNKKIAEDQLSIANLMADEMTPVIPPVKRYAKYNPPPLDLLNDTTTFTNVLDEDSEESAKKIEEALAEFKIDAEVKEITKAPAVTRFDLEMPPGVPVSRVTQRADDLQYKLAARGKVRIVAPILGKMAVGVEIPNREIDKISLKNVLMSEEYRSSKSIFTFAIGRDIEGCAITSTIDKMPHMLVAGSTGTGKSVCLNAVLASLLFRAGPSDLKLIVVDPKRVEFSMFRGLPHMLIERPITDPVIAINALQWAIDETHNRYKIFETYHYKGLADYNAGSEVRNGTLPKLPVVLIVIDELADLMLRAKRDVEDRINSIAATSRAAGINLIVATQRPSVDVITGTIKNNIPTRIAFSVQSLVDSRTILDQQGAEKLCGRGDMLYKPQGGDSNRVQGAFITDEELKDILEYIKLNNEADFDAEIEAQINVKKPEIDPDSVSNSSGKDGYDKLLPAALKFSIIKQSISTSLLQRKFKLGYNKAAGIIEKLEEMGYISPLDGSKPRSVLITMDEFENAFGDIDIPE